MSAPFRLGTALALVAILSVGSLWAASLPVYTGAPAAVTLSVWGSGTVKADDKVQYAEKPSLLVGTKSYFEGAYLELPQPADLAPYVGNKDNGLVVLVVQMPKPAAPATVPGMLPGMMPPGMMPPPGPPGPPGPGMPGMPGMPQIGTPLPAETLNHLRVVLITDKGQIDSGALDISTAVSANPDWLRLIVPLSQFASPADLAGAKLLGVMLAGNGKGDFNVGQLYLKAEQPPLTARIEGERVIVTQPNQKVELKAAPQPEAGKADYTWDIDFSNGLATDSLGSTATVEYPKEGLYLVSLQVADPAGAREARVDQVLVVVKK